MSQTPDYWQPPFDEMDMATHITVEVKVHFDGLQDTCSIWYHVFNTETRGWIACEGGGNHQNVDAIEHALVALRHGVGLARERLLPF